MIRVLHITGGMTVGGLETFIMNIYRNIDRNMVQFDFALLTPDIGEYEAEIKKLGGNIYHIESLSHPLKSCRQIHSLVKSNGYDIIHRHASHATIFLGLLAAKCAKANIIIAHSHNTKDRGESVHKLCRPLMNSIATDRLACSQVAGEWMYGKAGFKVINNGIDTNKFRYNRESSIRIRQELQLNDAFVIGLVARISDAKNHKFLIDIFKEVKATQDNSKLLIVGVGSLMDDIKAYVASQGLASDVIFTGVRADVPELMNAMNCFVMPSFYEGLPVTLVEAQCTGLKCVVSENITREIALTDNIKFLSLDLSARVWADEIIAFADGYDRVDMSDAIKLAKYDIQSTIEELMKIYTRKNNNI